MTLQEKADALFRHTFNGEATALACAPGRIEFIGNHTDYNAGTVLGASIDRQVCVAGRLRSDECIALTSDHALRVVTVTGRPLQRQAGEDAWANYSLGVIQVLETHGLPAHGGMELAVVSDLPVGAGLSSSAALELATALVVGALKRFSLPRAELVQACRVAENKFVGVPCGVLDQGVSGFGQRDHLVHIDCRGPEFSTIPLPAGVHFWIFNTHAKHALVDSLYATRHRECMDAAEILKVAWLADLTPEQVRAARSRLPEVVWQRARHVVEEIARVSAVRNALEAGDLTTVGRLLGESHESSRTLFENSTPELDFLVETLRGRAGMLGARLTGGGFGGAVMAMTDHRFGAAAAAEVAAVYASRFGVQPAILHMATGDGARLERG